MYCPKCGKENLPDAQSCRFCGCSLTGAPTGAASINVRVSGLAIASLVLGILSVFTCGITAIPAIILGIISLVLIEKSGGRITGRGFAIAGIIIPVVVFFLTMGILMPALMRTRQIAHRTVCSTNLSGIGKAMDWYVNDYNDELPRAGGPNTKWGVTLNWQADNHSDAFGLKNGDGQATISASLYLLVKYEDVTPKSFICKSDSGATEFKISDYDARDKGLWDLWDFGPNPSNHCSYAYHLPYSKYPLTSTYLPGMAVATDRNPWLDSPFTRAKEFSRFNPDGDTKGIKYGNTILHKEDGQNVLFLDGHVSFEKKSFCGVKDDNIYTFWGGSAPNWDRRKGVPPQIGSQPASRVDSLLVNDTTVANQK